MKTKRLVAATLALSLAVVPAHARTHGRNPFRIAAKHAAADAGGHVAEAVGIGAAVVAGLTIIGLTTWYVVAHHRKSQEVSSVSEAAKLATADVAACAEAGGGPSVACW